MSDITHVIGDDPPPKHIVIPVPSTMDYVECKMIYATLVYFDQDKAAAAEALGISLKTLYNRLKQYKEVENETA